MEPRSRRSVLRASLAWILVPAAARASDPDPIEVVTDIYRRASAGRGDGGGRFLWRDAKSRRSHFTARTAELWERAERATPKGDIGPLGFDPVTASQDPRLKSFDLKLEADAPDRARVLVLLTGHGEGRPYAGIRYMLLREGGRWLIDDISSGRGGGSDSWSVRKLLQAHIAENGAPR